MHLNNHSNLSRVAGHLKMLIYLFSKVIKKLRCAAVKNSTIDRSAKVESGSSVVNSSMERHTFCGYDCDISHCEIGSFTSIANDVVIGGGMHPMDWVSMSPVFYAGRDSVNAKFSEHEREAVKKTVIGHDVWIGRNALISQGVKIGHGAVVGMGSVVTKDVEPYSVVAGTPARLIGYRFDEELRKKLLKSEWWAMDEASIRKYAYLFTDPEAFLNKIVL